MVYVENLGSTLLSGDVLTASDKDYRTHDGEYSSDFSEYPKYKQDSRILPTEFYISQAGYVVY